MRPTEEQRSTCLAFGLAEAIKTGVGENNSPELLHTKTSPLISRLGLAFPLIKEP